MTMKIHSLWPWATALLACGAFCTLVFAAPSPVIYPAKGQNTAQADRDKYECFEWSKGQSGFDPMQAQAAAPVAAAPAPATAPQPTASTGSGSLTGMVKGAAGGAAVAELADRDAGKGAAVGVLGTAVRERMKQQQQGAQAQQQQLAAAQQAQLQAAQQQARAQQQRSTFDRGFAACLEARGYVVK